MGVFAALRNGFEKLAAGKWLGLWPFWQQEKKLERLIEEADANPKDAAKQNELLAELNKHRFPSRLFGPSYPFFTFLSFNLFNE